MEENEEVILTPPIAEGYFPFESSKKFYRDASHRFVLY